MHIMIFHFHSVSLAFAGSIRIINYERKTRKCPGFSLCMILMRKSLNKVCGIWKSDWLASWVVIFHGSNTHAHASYNNTQNTVSKEWWFAATNTSVS